MPKKVVTRGDWKWFGVAGHFIAAHKCLFHLHTHVGRYCVSTIGEYYLHGTEEYHTVQPTPPGASEHLYETMVFKLNRKGDAPESYREIDVERFITRDEADAGHVAMCEKWGAK